MIRGATNAQPPYGLGGPAAMYLSPRKHAVIKFCRKFLNKDQSYLVTNQDLEKVKEQIYQMIHIENRSCREIQELYNIKSSNFSSFIKDCLKVPLKTLSQATRSYYDKQNRSITDEKKLYYKQCQFKFDPYRYSFIPGFQLLKEHGIYHPTSNPTGVCRDHMVSKAFGWSNQVDSSIISHLANCQFLLNLDNIKKNSTSCITLADLKERILQWKNQDLSELNFKMIPIGKSVEHRMKLSEANRKVWQRKKAGLVEYTKVGRKPLIPPAELISMVNQLGIDEVSQRLNLSKTIIIHRLRRARRHVHQNF